jgi:hypothetical protein
MNMKRFYVLSLFLSGSVFMGLVAEPPHLMQQSSDCWLTSLTQIIYNMPTFIDVLCGAAGDEYLTKKKTTPYESTAKHFVILAREIRAKKVANEQHKKSLAALQAQFQISRDMQGMADSAQGLYFLTQSFADLNSFWKMCLSATCMNNFLYAAFEDPHNLRYKLLSNLSIGADPFADIMGDRYAMKESAITLAGEYIFFVIESTLSEGVYAFPGDLDLAKFPAPELLDQWQKDGKSAHYELIGISVWQGMHYFAYVKDQYDAPHYPWYHCDSLGDVVERVWNPNRDVLKSWEMGIHAVRPRILVYRQVSQKRFEDNLLRHLAEALRALA